MGYRLFPIACLALLATPCFAGPLNFIGFSDRNTYFYPLYSGIGIHLYDMDVVPLLRKMVQDVDQLLVAQPDLVGGKTVTGHFSELSYYWGYRGTALSGAITLSLQNGITMKVPFHLSSKEEGDAKALVQRLQEQFTATIKDEIAPIANATPERIFEEVDWLLLTMRSTAATLEEQDHLILEKLIHELEAIPSPGKKTGILRKTLPPNEWMKRYWSKFYAVRTAARTWSAPLGIDLVMQGERVPHAGIELLYYKTRHDYAFKEPLEKHLLQSPAFDDLWNSVAAQNGRITFSIETPTQEVAASSLLPGRVRVRANLEIAIPNQETITQTIEVPINTQTHASHIFRTGEWMKPWVKQLESTAPKARFRVNAMLPKTTTVSQTVTAEEEPCSGAIKAAVRDLTAQ